MLPTIVQTKTPWQFNRSQSMKELELGTEFVGKPLNALRTPAMVIDKAIFARNCARMHQNAKDWGADFRAHLKTHKTAEGTRLQLISKVDRTHAVLVSTLMEAWEVVNAGLVAEGTVNDILYALPVALNKVEDLSDLQTQMARYGGTIRIFIDHLAQVKFLEEYEKTRKLPKIWSVFIKIDGGQKRAGITTDPVSFKAFMTEVFASPVISVHGFYSLGSHSYASTSLSEATSFLSGEVQVVDTAAALALEVLANSPNKDAHSQPFVLAVGSTPTAHSASKEARAQLSSMLHGKLELHAGNYPLLDLQQLHTTLIDRSQIAQRVLATVISYYPGRGQDGLDEAMSDAGALAMSKDTGPISGYGEILGKAWKLGRISQEHGTLVQVPPDAESGRTDSTLNVGDIVEIVGQHACLTAANFSWYYIIDSDIEGGTEKVVDVWIPWKGW